MSLLLLIETSTSVCSAALIKNRSLLDIEESNEGYVHAEKLAVFIQNIFQRNNITPSDLSAVAVSGGPGSYTGLRIGVSTAKGICFGAGIPLISVPTLEALFGLARNIHAADYYVPMIDARRMEVYSCVYDEHGNQLKETSPVILEESSFAKFLEKGKTVFCGDGSAKYKEILNHPNAIFVESSAASAKGMLESAVRKFENKDFVDTAYYEPFYLKEFTPGKKKSDPPRLTEN